MPSSKKKSSSGPKFIIIGRISTPHGINGKLKVKVHTDFPERFIPLATVYVGQKPVVIDGVEWFKNGVILKFRNIDSVTEAERLQGQDIEVLYSQAHRLPEGSYYHLQLIGLKVWTTKGQFIGTISEIMTMDSNDNFVVRGDDGEILIPAIKDVVKSIDLTEKQIIIEAIPGLLDLNRKINS
ncbi:ribosome maturation factor RimM [Chloroflexota bacterium]